ncbi:biotin-dependent carboxyltransferase family protein [Salisediminibacterium halotolerans]|uniref:5-oxoprolinase subunit C family protein n=1 Tax=Salisediminibacterium halotolerans TaxID=517425 RepID=UPI000EAC9053|nr:biotin-dependent carboxyltransferase family protein [Salisediminibacterium halotolerans]RLJ78355.1 antagonist of KipI [Actinophytocola xinjiangensis]RPE88303.1 antagonist of KipI [Salisediminibacterium halotolerans]TWG37331.1 antagonist of KipI [Salisediminibacterium halotolerans]GEL06796.1 urea carboxylase [Salisediminibacterium halotolerans]
MTEVFKTIKPGLLTTIQDLGRSGYQQYGITTSGAMDPFSLKVANLLVGNSRNEAALEITLMGPELEIMTDRVIAFTGADLSPEIDGRPVPMWTAFRVKKGMTLTFGRPKTGSRTYLAFSGGINVPEVLGSRSTDMKAEIGGINGRELQKGDRLIGQAFWGRSLPGKSRSLHPSLIPSYESPVVCRVIPGPDDEMFTEKSKATFYNTEYTVNRQSDRMGVHLDGAFLAHTESADILSDAILPGTIQVPGAGKPIMLMADRQTTGGYPRLATVISTDLMYAGQLSAGQRVCFQPVSVTEAQNLRKKQEYCLTTIARSV